MKRALGFALVALLAAGCSGDALSIWKVSSIAGTAAPSCYKGGKSTDNNPVTTTSQQYIGDWELYPATNGKFQLHVGTVDLSHGQSADTVYDGSAKGNVYTFEGLTNDLTLSGDPSAPTTTVTASYDEIITMTVNGDTFTGTWVHSYSATCTGSCPATFADDNPSCSISDSLAGARIPVQDYHAE